ncbi:MAG: mandelate racemase [Myxococcaceae bacterium]|nr:mandelate racemase [Myxococcaceae bacterium]
MVRRGRQGGEAPVEALEVSAFRIPTATPVESDGTAEWRFTTLVVVELRAGGASGLGYTYADRATAHFVQEVLRPHVIGRDPMVVPAVARELLVAVRNHGREGVAAMAISAVDVALWDLKARLFGVPLATLLGPVRDAVDLYGSGGFTSYTLPELEAQLGGWAAQGFRRVKMKVGRDPSADPERVRAARRAIGGDVELFVDANGAYDRKRALRLAETFAADADVRWFEEPVSSDDREGLRLLRDRAPAQMEIAAGEYGYHPQYFRTLLEAGAVDVLMADATRCLGISGFLTAGALCDAFGVPLSAHCAPMLHLSLGACAPRLRHLEYFFDHARIEALVFDGFVEPRGGVLRPDRTRPGLGLELKRKDAERYAV